MKRINIGNDLSIALKSKHIVVIHVLLFMHYSGNAHHLYMKSHQRKERDILCAIKPDDGGYLFGNENIQYRP